MLIDYWEYFSEINASCPTGKYINYWLRALAVKICKTRKNAVGYLWIPQDKDWEDSPVVVINKKWGATEATYPMAGDFEVICGLESIEHAEDIVEGAELSLGKTEFKGLRIIRK